MRAGANGGYSGGGRGRVARTREFEDVGHTRVHFRRHGGHFSARFDIKPLGMGVGEKA